MYTMAGKEPGEKARQSCHEAWDRVQDPELEGESNSHNGLIATGVPQWQYAHVSVCTPVNV